MAAKAFSDPTARLRLIALDRVSNDPLESDVPLQTTFPASLPLFDLASETPLPEIVNFPPASPAPPPAPAHRSGVAQSTSIQMPHKPTDLVDQVWLDGDVLMCGCPDCGAPMSIRLWLMIADCWQCGTSIELSEEQERAVQKLLDRREREKQTAAGPGVSPDTGTPDPPAKALPSRSQPPAASQRPAGSQHRESPQEKKSHLPPPLPTPRRQATAAARSRAEREIRRRAESPSVVAWFCETFGNLPAWLVSMVFHMVLLTLLGLLTFPATQEDLFITLATTVQKEVTPGGQIVVEPTEDVKFDLPIPRDVDLDNPQEMEELKSAAKEAKILQEVNTAEFNLPDIDVVRQQIQSVEGASRTYAARDPRVRVEMVKKEGGTTLTEAAVARALRWLARQQESPGHWQLNAGNRSDTAATSLALLPFLGAGQSHLVGRYRQTVSGGLGFLVRIQKEDGDLRHNSAGNTGMYAHGQSAIVLCEAFMLSGDESLRLPAQKAIDFIVDAQYPDGGWKYTPNRDGGARRGDTSVMGWQLMALQSARAAGLKVPTATFERASHYLDGVSYEHGSQYAYARGNRPTHVMTAEALLCRMYMGWTLDDPGLKTGIRWLAENHPPRRAQTNFYYWYYATQAFHHYGGSLWNRWNLEMRDILVQTQEKSGANAGSWTPQGGHAGSGGRVYVTSFAACNLEVYYRHLPIFRQIDLE